MARPRRARGITCVHAFIWMRRCSHGPHEILLFDDPVLITAGLSRTVYRYDLYVTHVWHTNALEVLYNSSYESFMSQALYNTAAGSCEAAVKLT